MNSFYKIFILHFCAHLLFLIIHVAGFDHLNANHAWQCENCGDLDEVALIFGIVRRAIYTESREVYLNFDHSWMDNILASSSRVVIKRIDIKELANAQIAADTATDKSLHDQTFTIVVALPNANLRSSTIPPSTMTQFVDGSGVAIDSFLKLNPCYIPLHDPIVPAASAVRARGSKTGQTAAEAQLYDLSTVIVRLPTYPFTPTCTLYSFITKKQFPAICPTADEKTSNGDRKVHVNWLGMIGWANCLHPVVDHMLAALHFDRVFITPRAWSDGAHPPFDINVTTSILPENGMKNGMKTTTTTTVKRVMGPWGSWADRSACPADIYAWDPWACHFISLSKCNTPELHNVPFIESASNAKDKYPPAKNEYQIMMVRGIRVLCTMCS
jgi:hypothetical protein